MSDSNYNLLLVDDSNLQRVITEKVLEPLDVNVISAESGEIALSLFDKQSVFLVLMDVSMEGIDGFETAQRMRQMKHPNSTVPIIFITGTQDQPENISKGYDAGGVDYILKPIDPHSLFSKVRIFFEIMKQRDTIEVQLDEIQAKNILLEKQVKEIELLSGLVPICASCKDVRDVTGYWKTIEQFFSDQTNTEFSHSICPECRDKLYPTISRP